jgi:hypothetical protein
MSSPPRPRPDWPDPLRTSVTGALLLAIATPLWPALAAAVAALAALAAVAGASRRVDELAVATRTTRLRRSDLELTGAVVGGWGSFFLLAPVLPALGAALLALSTVALLHALRRGGRG